MFEVRWFCFSLTSLLMVVGVACRKNSSLAEPVVVMTGLLKKGRQSRLGQRLLKAIERTYGASLVTTALKNIDSRRMELRLVFLSRRAVLMSQALRFKDPGVSVRVIDLDEISVHGISPSLAFPRRYLEPQALAIQQACNQPFFGSVLSFVLIKGTVFVVVQYLRAVEIERSVIIPRVLLHTPTAAQKASVGDCTLPIRSKLKNQAFVSPLGRKTLICGERIQEVQSEVIAAIANLKSSQVRRIRGTLRDLVAVYLIRQGEVNADAHLRAAVIGIPSLANEIAGAKLPKAMARLAASMRPSFM